MKIWDALKTTDPKYTKLVTFGRKFTSINSQWQLQRMTEQFGPIGRGWGYTVEHDVQRLHDWYALAVADVTIWWRDAADDKIASYGPVRGTAPLLEPARDKGKLIYEGDGATVKLHLDDDAGKKAMTDALTKGLSHIGLSADVFLGLFDDNKYVRRVAEQFAADAGGIEGRNPPNETAGEFPPLPDEDRALLKNGNDERSQYEVNKRKGAEDFVARTLETFSSMAGSDDIAAWYKTPISPKGRSSNRDAVERLKEAFPDLGTKLETAADEVRLRNGARLQ